MGWCIYPGVFYGLVDSFRSGLWVSLFIPEWFTGWFIHPEVVNRLASWRSFTACGAANVSITSWQLNTFRFS